jgi:putative drug exporter of the RND superfamily
VRFHKAIPRAVAGKRGAWLVLVVTAALSFALISWGPGPTATTTGPDVPASSQGAQVALLQQSLPNANVTTALVVYSAGPTTLTALDRTALSARAEALAHYARGGVVAGPLYSSDGRVSLVTIPLTATSDTAKLADRLSAIAADAREGLPPGVLMHVTGPAGFQADLNNVFSGANTRLLLVTVMVVAVLLVITYRSPWLWLVPLVVIGLAEQVASVAATRLAAHAGVPINAATTGILSVLVFGAGTDYALLFIARYRDELHTSEDRYAAMRRAWSGTAPAITASGATVTLSLLVLLAAAIPSTRGLGFACAVGIVIAVAFALLVLPPALVIFGRGLFWPRIPRAETAPTRNGRFWARLGATVARHPGAVTIGSIVILALPALGLAGVHIGLTQTQQFRDQPPSVVGENILARAFPAGQSEPVAIISASSAAQHVAAVARSTPGVAGAYVGDTNGTLTEVDAVLRAAPGTPGAFSAVEALRANVDVIPGANAVVGGPDAITLDSNQAWARDRLLIIPIVLGVIFGVLILLLRALVAPLLLIVTVAASFLAAFGAGQFVFTNVYGFSALDVGVPLLSFLFLAALGVDYNIFLVTRAREEAFDLGTNAGMQRALAMTGSVITSAGILLASVFAVLGVLPLIALTQIGVIVGIGVLLDTLLVRTVLVPALAFLAGERFWWPGRVVGHHRGSVLHRSRPIEADVRTGVETIHDGTV